MPQPDSHVFFADCPNYLKSVHSFIPLLCELAEAHRDYGQECANKAVNAQHQSVDWQRRRITDKSFKGRLRQNDAVMDRKKAGEKLDCTCVKSNRSKESAEKQQGNSNRPRDGCKCPPVFERHAQCD